MTTTLYIFWTAKLLLIAVLLYKLKLRSWARRSPNFDNSVTVGDRFPKVCIQLPIYCEADHVEGLLYAVSKIKWPRDKLEIQLLDDSTDETLLLSKRLVAKLRKNSPELNLQFIHRSDRTGYKAGALNHGMKQSDAEYFAVFDCDFRPEPNFLMQAMQHFSGQTDLAAVQFPWSYRNIEQNVLTAFQSMMLNLHFHVEQNGRFLSSKPFNFNGSAGIWSRKALDDAGGWSSCTVTEDLYLSYLVQDKGWRLVFDERFPVSSELPQDFRSFKIQQKRWAQGNGEVLRLLYKKIIKAPWALASKVDSFLHLLGYSVGGLVVALYLSAPFWIGVRGNWIAQTSALDPFRLVDASVWLLLVFCFFGLYLSPEIYQHQPLSLKTRIKKSILLLLASPLPAFVTITSYLKGLFSRPRLNPEFHRTPKSKRYIKRSLFDFDLILLGAFLLVLGVQSYATSQYVLGSLFLGQALLSCSVFIAAFLKPKSKVDESLNESLLAQGDFSAAAGKMQINRLSLRKNP